MTPPFRKTAADSGSGRTIRRLRRARAQTEASVLAIGKLLNNIVEVATEDVEAVRQNLGISGPNHTAQSSTITQSIQAQSRLVKSFVDELRAFNQRQLKFSEAANHAFETVTQCSSSVSQLMEMSHVLSLNLRMESGRLGNKGAAVSTISGEMMQFSKRVREANTRIVNALFELQNSLPQIRDELGLMNNRTFEFSEELDAKMQDVERETNQLDTSLKANLARTEQKNKAILACSLSTLSELQFQDPVAQELQKTELEMTQLQGVLSRHGLEDGFGGEMEEANVPAGVSGEVVLF